MRRQSRRPTAIPSARQFLQLIDFNVSISASLYASYYFELRTLCEKAERDFTLKPLSEGADVFINGEQIDSGLGNAVNPIMSLAHGDVYGTPMVLVIGWRGCPGHKDEPQHVVQGRQMIKQLESLGIDIVIMPNEADEAKGAFDDAVAAAERTSQPVALLVPPKTFMPYKAAKKTVPAAPPQAPTREEAIGAILADLVGPEDAVVSTTGFTSREVYELRANLGQSHEQDFLCVGSMGHALAIAQGIASAQLKSSGRHATHHRRRGWASCSSSCPSRRSTRRSRPC